MHLPMETPPTWASDYCYYFYFLAAIQFVVGLFGIFKLGTKNLSVSIVLLLSIAINALTTMMIFWMCRASLDENRRASLIVKL
jgi:NADH:ubiquinone oxidoreductase subunit K